MDTGDHNAGVGGGDNFAIEQRPIQGGVAIFLVTSCYRNWR